MNEEQNRAIHHKDGPMLVLAGPGSGKTYTLIRRVRNLTKNHFIPPEKILVITFTKAAAESMKSRYLSLMGTIDSPVNFGTIHSLCYSILLDIKGGSSLNMISNNQQFSIIRSIYTGMYPDKRPSFEDVRDIYALISYVSSQMDNKIDEEGLMDFSGLFNCIGDFKSFYEAYTAYKEDKSLYDYDDLIKQSYYRLSNNPVKRKEWQDRFNYIMVDEFQDTSEMQFEIIRMLTGKKNNIFVVGDDDQSIYAFRGAKPEILKKFEKVYPERCVVNLFENYRSEDQIIKISRKLISKNKERYEKAIYGKGNNKGWVYNQCFSSEDSQYRAILKDIKRRRESGENINDIAVLFRTNLQADIFASMAGVYGIRNRMAKNKRNYNKFFQDLINYFGYAADVKSLRDIISIVNRPDRGFSTAYLENSNLNFGIWKEKCYRCNDRKEYEKILIFQRELENIRIYGPSLGMRYLLKGIGYEKVIAKDDFAMKVYERIQCMADEFNNWKDFYERLLVELSAIEENTKNGINILTLHGCKGLEFDTVYIPDLNEGIIPMKKANKEREVEEERRLLYVGMTRAKTNLILTNVKERNNRESKPSPFLKDIYDKD